MSEHEEQPAGPPPLNADLVLDRNRSDPVSVQAFFLHDRLLTKFGSEESARAATTRMAATMFTDAVKLAYVGEAVAEDIYNRVRPPELLVSWVRGEVRLGQLVTLTQRMCFKRQPGGKVHFQSALVGAPSVNLHGELNLARSVGKTGGDMLRSARRVTILATIAEIETVPSAQESDAAQLTHQVNLVPLFIGRLMEQGTRSGTVFDEPRRRYPGGLDQFSKMQQTKAPTQGELDQLASMSEALVKAAFARIIGEPYVDKDWGGEKSDLYSARLSREGKPLTAAFAFKGPGRQGRLYIAGMGKRGDQALRLYREPADLMVVQHWTQIDSEVVALMEALARANFKEFMVLDGHTTAHILKAYGELPGWTPSARA